MAYKGFYKGEGAAAFDAALSSIATYEPPELPDVVRELSCTIPDFRGDTASRFRFLLSEAGVVFDIFRPGQGIDDDSALVIQMSRTDEAVEGFPEGDLPRVFDSQLELRGGQPRLQVSHTTLFGEKHVQLLESAGLGELVVATFAEAYFRGAAWVDPIHVQRDIPQLPDRLVEMATQL